MLVLQIGLLQFCQGIYRTFIDSLLVDILVDRTSVQFQATGLGEELIPISFSIAGKPR